MIRSLNINEIFVFGSNEAGIHGAGAAKFARRFGAINGVGVGHCGQTYAIPTKDKRISTLPLSNISTHIDNFIIYTKSKPDLIFLVTQIGCGLAGYNPHQIAPLFKECINFENVKLPESFIKIIHESN